MEISRLLLASVLMFTGLADAQFYAPQTDFHDPAQRVFAVEAARVIAWEERAAKPRIAEVVFALKTAPEGETAWKIGWRDEEGAAVRELTVRYAEAELRDGPAWYRNVWRQLRGEREKGASAPADALLSAFWDGAKAAGLSRMEAIAAAEKLCEKPVANAVETARLAGCLTHAALPSLSTSTQLDSLLLARAAAWLCRAEELGVADLPDAWAPLLLLAGREKTARELWAKPAAPREAGTPLIRMWETLITQPPARVGLVAAVQPENREYSAAIFCAYGGVEPAYRDMWIELLRDLWPLELRKRLHDYGPTITHGDRNRVPLEDFAARSIRAALEQLKDMPGPPGDIDKVRALATKALAAQSEVDVPAPSAELRELLNRATAEAAGPLIPTAVATRRDVLNFAWEIAGQQLATLVGRLVTTGGAQLHGEELGAAWIGAISGWDAFQSRIDAPREEPLADSTRYEFLTGQEIAARLSDRPPIGWETARDLPTVYLRRRWLVDAHRGVLFAVERDAGNGAIAALIRRALGEGGQWVLGALAVREQYPSYRIGKVQNPAAGAPLFRGDQSNFDDVLDALGLREEIARVSPLSIGSALTLIHRKFADGREPLAHAQALERLHWESGVAFAVEDVMLAYVTANAAAEARRFFSQGVAAVPNRYMSEITLPEMALALALLEGDDAAAEALLAVSPGLRHHGAGFKLAVARGDIPGAEKAIATYLEHFPKSWGAWTLTRLKEWLPLLPALNDRAHPEHRRAVESFPHGHDLLFTQWLLLTRAGLPEKEAVRFLQGGQHEAKDRPRESVDPRTASLLIAAAKKDAEEFERTFAENVTRGARENRVLLTWLRAQLRKVPRLPAQPDQRPPGSGWLYEQLRAAVATKQ